MKDYRLSEIKEICRCHPINCKGCEFYNDKYSLCEIRVIVNSKHPEDWEIGEQPKDMTELFVIPPTNIRTHIQQPNRRTKR